MFRFCIFFVFLFWDVEGENLLLNYGFFLCKWQLLRRLPKGHLAMLKDRQAVAVKVGRCGVSFIIATRWFLWIKLGSLREFWTVDDAMHLGYRSFHNLFQILCIYVCWIFAYLPILYSCMWLNAGILPLCLPFICFYFPSEK